VSTLRLQSGTLVVLTLALLAVFAITSPTARAEKRVALIIGNSAYPMAPLRNPINDARAMAKALNQLGFEVMLRTNLSQRGMIGALRDFGARLGRDGEAVFYFSGHGMQVKGRNYLIPVDADIRGEDEVPYMSLDMAQVLDKLEASRSRANIVILDACRNNPFVRTFRSGRMGLAQMDAPVGTLIAFATAPGSEARDGDGEFGTYTRHLLQHLPAPGLPVELVFRRVREGVTAETKDRQVPWESSSLKGDFFFNADAVAATQQRTPATRAQSVDPATIELAFWNSIKDSTNPADFDAYLKRYPSGSFTGLAQNRVEVATRSPASTDTRPAVDSPAPAGTAPSRENPAQPAQTSEPPPAAKIALRAPDAATARTGRRAPSIGDSWTYQFIDERHNVTRATVTHEIIAIDAEAVTERLALADKASQPSQEQSALSPQVLERQLAGLTVTEFAPYLAARAELQVGKAWADIPGLAHMSTFDRWRVQAKAVGREKVRVPAGEFDAYRVELEAERPHSVSPFDALYVTRISLIAWYAPEVKRVVKTVRKTSNQNTPVLDTDRYELVSFKLR
jgi:hypothetical protein